MPAEKTQIRFEALVASTKTKMATLGQYSQSGMPEGGELELTLKVKQPVAPQAPRKPDIPYAFSDGYNRDATWKKRPADAKRKATETDADYDARQDVIKRREDQAAYDIAKEAYDAKLAAMAVAMERHSRAVARHMERVRGYAGLIGLVSTIGGVPLDVTMTPVDSGMLPGFGLSLPPASTLEREDDEADE